MSPPLLSLAALQSAGRMLPLPFRLTLPDHTELLCTALLRVLPGKRLVLRATHGGTTVLAKLFFGTRQWQQECDGYARLHKTGVPTPALLAEFPLDDGGVSLYSFIEHALPLDRLWQDAQPSQKAALLDRLLPLLHQLYRGNVLQRDLHLGNFLLQGAELLVLDPASCDTAADAAAQQANLALLVAQLPFNDWPLALEKLPAAFPSFDRNVIANEAQHCWQQRQHDYLRKITRDCTDIADESHGSLRILCRRDALTEALLSQLQHLDALPDTATSLKHGNSARVFLFDCEGRRYVAKQYLYKDWWRALRRAFRPSRAARSWHIAHALRFAGIGAPAPVALVEQKRGPFVTNAWYLSEYGGGRNLRDCWQERDPTQAELDALHSLFPLLQHSKISHGDLKATNLLSDGRHLSLIDYDGARIHSCQATLARALANDKQRLLQNWNGRPELQARIATVIGA